jgi:hypothetical protein
MNYPNNTNASNNAGLSQHESNAPGTMHNPIDVDAILEESPPSNRPTDASLTAVTLPPAISDTAAFTAPPVAEFQQARPTASAFVRINASSRSTTEEAFGIHAAVLEAPSEPNQGGDGGFGMIVIQLTGRDGVRHLHRITGIPPLDVIQAQEEGGDTVNGFPRSILERVSTRLQSSLGPEIPPQVLATLLPLILARTLYGALAPDPRGLPPASREAIQGLALVTVQLQDLVFPANRECSICLCEHVLYSQVARLPCAHFYCQECITTWLYKKCTCPLCLYQLPTANAAFERGRLRRMALRKPRFARHELERLSMAELMALKGSAGWSTGPMFSKSELIEDLIRFDCIALIAQPDLLACRWSDLQAMDGGSLKECMLQAGVYYHDGKFEGMTTDAILRLFLASGRVRLVPEDEIEDASSACCSIAQEAKPAAVDSPTPTPTLEAVLSEDSNDTQD